MDTQELLRILEDPKLFQEKGQLIRNDLLRHVKLQDSLIEQVNNELETSRTANKAFKQALSEIGTVVISVAMGDLSKKWRYTPSNQTLRF